VDTSILFEGADLRLGSHLGDGGEEPVCGPALAAIHAEGESAGPAGESRKLPSSDNSVYEATGIASQSPAFAHRHIGDPVEVDLMRKIKIRDRARPVRRKGIGQAASD